MALDDIFVPRLRFISNNAFLEVSRSKSKMFTLSYGHISTKIVKMKRLLDLYLSQQCYYLLHLETINSKQKLINVSFEIAQGYHI
jgi:hypothetical protein